MAANLLERYVWLIDVVRRHGRITFQEVDQLWQNSVLGDGNPLVLRTFHKHREAIRRIFHLTIECNSKAGYTYSIQHAAGFEKDTLRRWLVDSYAMLNQLQVSPDLESRIQFEDIPSGQMYLTTLVDAMRLSKAVEITYQSFRKPKSTSFILEPYGVKVFNRRWYVVGRSPFYNKVMTYGLDRIRSIQITEKVFRLLADFSLDNYFEGCCGIMTDRKIERVVVRVYGAARKYLVTLPIHPSQQEIESDEHCTTLEFQVRPTFDFVQSLFMQMDQVEVVEPQWLREEVRVTAEKIGRRNSICQ